MIQPVCRIVGPTPPSLRSRTLRTPKGAERASVPLTIKDDKDGTAEVTCGKNIIVQRDKRRVVLVPDDHSGPEELCTPSMASLNTNTPPPEAEASVKVLSSIPRGRFSLTGGVTTSRHGASTTFPTDSMNSLPPDDLSGGNGTPNESLEAHPSNAASRVDFLSSLPFEVSIYILLLADAFDVARWRGVCTTWNILCSDNQVWRDHFHRNPAWRVRPDLLKAVEDQQTSKACASRLSHVDDLADDAEEPIHLATPTKNSSSRAKAASRHSNPTGQSQSSSPRKKSGVSTSDLLGLTTDLSGLRIGPSSSPTLQRQHQHVSDTLSFSSTEASFSTPARPKSGSIGSPHFNPSQPVPSPYFIKPLKAPLRGLNWMELYRTRHQIDERWKLGQSKTSVLRGHRDNIYCIRSDSDYIITGSRDPSVKLVHTQLLRNYCS